MVARVLISGDAAIIRLLQDLDKRLLRKVHAKALRAAGALLKADMKARVPVRTGKLRRSIGIRLTRANKRGVYAVIVGPSAATEFYARFVEYGTKNATAKPFMRPAKIAQKTPVIDEYEKHLVDAIKELKA